MIRDARGATRGEGRHYNGAADGDAAAALLAESDEQVKLMRSPNQVEAVRANMERRAAVFVD